MGRVGGTGAKKNRRRLQRPSERKDDTLLLMHEENEKEKKEGQTVLKKKSKSTKIKKPKHLKRKLEALDANDGDRELAFQRMQQWQLNKTAYQQKGEKKNRKKRVVEHTVPIDLDSSTTSNNETQAFPRGDTGTDSATSAPPQQPRSVVSVPESQTETLSTSKFPDASTGRKHEESDDSSVEAEAESQRRQRGRRRRGRKAFDKQTTEPDEPLKQMDANAEDEAERPKDGDELAERAIKQLVEVQQHVDSSSEKRAEKNTDRKRYCIGRKPVTDFVVGERYEGRVVYVKPFGLFLDIGCHADAFCHVSRLSDTFVEEPGVMFCEGDAVSARVVEIDREKKRITVSLQSDAKIADEKASCEARLDRRRKHQKHKPNASRSGDIQKDILLEPAAKKRGGGENERKPENEIKPELNPKRQRADVVIKPESQMTPQEVKRARKLERRAARRFENDLVDSQ